METARQALIDIENKKDLQKKNTQGDASETGLIKFVEPICGLEETRKAFPNYNYEMTSEDGTSRTKVLASIPFSSEIKFNLQIRDCNVKETSPKTKADNLVVYMKGAPERILKRCSKILINGEEVTYDEDMKKLVNFANDSFGKMGERVLAFAKCELDPTVFTKDPKYQFDMKDWKHWFNNEKATPGTNPGWFPMFNLTLVAVVSLNDPPRVGVAQSVAKCRAAGIKVIMVTGDQPPTAAAIAYKVNII